MRTVALVIAIVLGIVAVIGVAAYVKGQRREVERVIKPVEVAVARQAIKAGEALTEEMVAFASIPASSLSGLNIGRSDIERYYGYKVNRNVDRSAQILKSHFISREVKAASSILREGKRAITIGVDPTTGVAGLIQPGDHVDVLVTTTGKGKGSGPAGAVPETWLVLSDVTVLAVDDRMGEGSFGTGESGGYRRGYSNLTLAVTPLEAQVLTYLKDFARLTFTLRSRSELGEKEAAAAVEASNVQSLAQQANAQRQKEIQQLQKIER